MKKLLIGLMLVIRGFGQTPPTTLNVATNPLPNVTNIGVSKSVTVGQNSYYYWVVTTYGVGNTSLSVPVSALNVGTGTVTISWIAPPSPSGYAFTYVVLRTTTQTFPQSGTCSNCLVGTSNSTSIVDSLGSLSGYTLATYSKPSGYFYLDIVNGSNPEAMFNLGGKLLVLSEDYGASLPVDCAIGQGFFLTTNNSYNKCGFNSTWYTVSPSGSATVTIASGVAVLGTSAIASTACGTVVTVAATGVLTTDAINTTFNSDPTGVVGYQPLTTGTLTIFPYPTANNVNYKVCNLTASSITPGAITLNWRVSR